MEGVLYVWGEKCGNEESFEIKKEKWNVIKKRGWKEDFLIDKF